MKRLSVVALCLLVLIIGCSKKTDVSGIWKGKLIHTSGNSIDVDAMLKQKEKDVSGTLTLKRLGGQLKLTGAVSGNTLSFNTEIYNGLYISFVGKIEKMTIKGKAEVTMQGPNIPGGTDTDEMTLELTNSQSSSVADKASSSESKSVGPETYNKEPAPYTQEAMEKLANAMQSVGQLVPKPGMTKEESCKMLYDWYREIYSKAGYDLDKSIIQLESDLKKDPKYAAPFLYQTLTLGVTVQLSEMRKDKTVDTDKLFSQETLVALDKMLANKKKQVENAEKAKIAKAEGIRKTKDDIAKGIYRGEIVTSGMDSRGDGYSLSDMSFETGVFGVITIAEYKDLEKRPQLHQQLKQLVGKRVTVKGRQVNDFYTVFDLDKGIEIIPDQQ